MKRKIIHFLSVGIFLVGCNENSFQDTNSTLISSPLFYELVNEEGQNYFEAHPEIDFDGLKILAQGLPGSAGEGKLVDAGEPYMVNGKKVFYVWPRETIYILFPNDEILDTLEHWKKTNKKKNYNAWLEDPILYYSYNKIEQGFIDLAKEDISLRNNMDYPSFFDPLILTIVKK